MRTVTTTVYTFDELSTEAQAKAIECYRQAAQSDADLDFSVEWMQTAGKLIGIDVKELHYCISYSQGDGASFDGSYAYAKGAVKAVRKEFGGKFADDLAEIASKLQDVQASASYKLAATVSQHGRYSHSGTMAVSVYHTADKDVSRSVEQEVTDLLREFADLAHDHLVKDYEHQTSDEVIGETLQANEYEFDEHGIMV